MKTVYEIDGLDLSTVREFYEIISRALIPGAGWGHNLDAFNDILYGGFGTPENGFILRWKNSQVSRERLSFPETVRQLEWNLTNCDPGARSLIRKKIKQAQNQIGPTAFDWLLEIIEKHCPGGSEEASGVELILE